MTRITIDVDDEWLELARQELGTETKVATINAALREVGHRQLVAESLAAMRSVVIEYTGSPHSFRYGGGRDLDELEEKARRAEAAHQAARDSEPV